MSQEKDFDEFVDLPVTDGAPGQREEARAEINRLPVISAKALGLMGFPPIRWVVPDILPEGATILAGRPKLGKSWLALDIALAVARGDYCLGDRNCEQGDVLYLALEDNRRRLKSRIAKISPPHSAEPWPERLELATEWPRCEDGGLQMLRKWASTRELPRLIIVDVLAQFRTGRNGQENSYEADYRAVKSLQALASEFGLAILIVHHVRKGGGDFDPFEQVSGTLGLTGAADTALILDRGTSGCSLYGRGRDIQEFEKAVTFNQVNCCWTIRGDASEVRMTDERGRILAMLKEADDQMNPKAIAAQTEMPRNNVDRLLGKMVTAGEVVKTKRGRYAHPDRSDLLTGSILAPR